MKRLHRYRIEKTEANWQVLGELELPDGSAVHDRLDTWLEEILSPLILHADMVNKIKISAQEAAERTTPLEQQTGNLRSVHLLVLSPAGYASNGQTWGFFRIEKRDVARTDDEFQRYVIEFYLYLEN